MEGDIIGGIYRHFKGNFYKLLLVATDTETGKETAIYESLKDKKLWCKPMEMFLSPVDREKYPDVKQELRFELAKVCANCKYYVRDEQGYFYHFCSNCEKHTPEFDFCENFFPYCGVKMKEDT